VPALLWTAHPLLAATPLEQPVLELLPALRLSSLLLSALAHSQQRKSKRSATAKLRPIDAAAHQLACYRLLYRNSSSATAVHFAYNAHQVYEKLKIE
jgi:hypothetical protein